MIASFL